MQAGEKVVSKPPTGFQRVERISAIGIGHGLLTEESGAHAGVKRDLHSWNGFAVGVDDATAKDGGIGRTEGTRRGGGRGQSRQKDGRRHEEEGGDDQGGPCQHVLDSGARGAMARFLPRIDGRRVLGVHGLVEIPEVVATIDA